MTHYMKLRPEPFSKIACGKKTIELRLNDEKRQVIKIDDIIEFSNTDNKNETIRVRVINLHHFGSFAELYTTLPLEKCGYFAEELTTASPKDMDAYYSAEKQSKYGALGIEIELVKNRDIGK